MLFLLRHPNVEGDKKGHRVRNVSHPMPIKKVVRCCYLTTAFLTLPSALRVNTIPFCRLLVRCPMML